MLYNCNHQTGKSEIAANFKEEIGATSMQRNLDKLEKKITSKLYGKIKVYLVNKNLFEEKDDPKLDQKIDKYSKEGDILREGLSALNAEIEVLNGTLSIEQLIDSIHSLTETIAENE